MIKDQNQLFLSFDNCVVACELWTLDRWIFPLQMPCEKKNLSSRVIK